MLFLPDGISAFPIPRYLENALRLRTGRTRIPLASLSNSSLSPIRTPSTRRISRGTVICPLLVIVACFCIASLHIPYFTIVALLRSMGKRQFSERGSVRHCGGLPFSCMLFLSVPGVHDSARSQHRLARNASAGVAFPVVLRVGTPKFQFSKLNSLPADASLFTLRRPPRDDPRKT